MASHPLVLIDAEFRDLLSPLTPEEQAGMESLLLSDGCRDALVAWSSTHPPTLVEGHHRREMCIKNDIPYQIVVKDFASRDEVLAWIIQNQLSRRNLSPDRMAYLRGKQQEVEKRGVGNPTGKNKSDTVSVECRQNDGIPKKQRTSGNSGSDAESGSKGEPKPKPRRTSGKLAGQHKVSSRTVERDAKYAKAVDVIAKAVPEAKAAILDGSKVPRKQVEQLAKQIEAKPEEAERLVAELLAGADDEPVVKLPETATDPLGIPISGEQVQVLQTLDLFKQADKALEKAAKLVAQIAKAPGGHFLLRQCSSKGKSDATIAYSLPDIQNARSTLKATRPYSSVCPYCHHARKTDLGCKACLGVGWVPKSAFASCPDDYRQAVELLAKGGSHDSSTVSD